MATLPTLRAGAVNTTGLPTTGSIIVTPGSDTALSDDSDATFDGQDSNASGTYQHGRDLDNMPSDFGTMDTLSIVLRRAWESAPSNSTWNTIGARIMTSDGAFVLAALNSGGGFQTISSNITDTTPTDSSTVPFSYVATTANKTSWDGAIVQLNWTRTRNKGGDALGCRVHEATITGTYTLGAAPITSDGASTFPAVTAAASGTVGLDATVASTLPAVTAAASGTHVPPAITSDGASTFPATTAAASGTHTPPAITSDGASTFPAITAAAAATTGLDATVASTLPATTAAASGSESFLGDVNSTLPAVAAAASGTHTPPAVTSDGASTFPAVTVAATGTSGTDIVGDVVSVFPATTAAASGTHTPPAITSTLAVTLPGVTAAVSGVALVDAAVASTFPATTAAASGSALIDAAVASVFPATTAAATGLTPITGTVAATLPAVTAAAVGIGGVNLAQVLADSIIMEEFFPARKKTAMRPIEL